MEIALVLSLLVLVIVLFATKKHPVDVITLVLLCALVLTGVGWTRSGAQTVITLRALLLST